MKPVARHRIKRFAKATIVAVNIVASAALLLAAYGGLVNPLSTPVGAILAMTFPLTLVVMIVLFIVNLLWMRRLALLNISMLAICWGPLTTYCPLHFLRPSVSEIEKMEGHKLKVMTFNVLGFYDLTGQDEYNADGNTTIGYILDQDADVVVLQEGADILNPRVRHVSQSQHRALMATYPHTHVDHNSLSILSKYPLRAIKVDADSIAGLEICRYDLRVAGKTIHLFNVHLQSIGLTDEDKQVYKDMTEGDTPEDMGELRTGIFHKLAHAFRARARQAQAVREELNEVDGNILLCGDFNDIPGSYAYRKISGSDLKDVYEEAGFGPAITYHADKFYFRIDQMLYRGALEPLRAWTGDCPSSDHYPLIAYFKITDN